MSQLHKGSSSLASSFHSLVSKDSKTESGFKEISFELFDPKFQETGPRRNGIIVTRSRMGYIKKNHSFLQAKN